MEAAGGADQVGSHAHAGDVPPHLPNPPDQTPVNAARLLHNRGHVATTTSTPLHLRQSLRLRPLLFLPAASPHSPDGGTRIATGRDRPAIEIAIAIGDRAAATQLPKAKAATATGPTDPHRATSPSASPAPRASYPSPHHEHSRAELGVASEDAEEDGSVFLRDGDEGAKYKSIDDLSDDEEHEMDMSDSDNSDDGEPAHKRSKPNPTTPKSGDSGDAVPRWSNPDPYTALPPPDPTQRKKTDVVQLIRKARVEAEEAKDKAAPALDEFISFDADSEDEEEKAREEAEKAREAEKAKEADAWPPRRPVDNGKDADAWPPRRGYTDDNGRRSDPLGSRKRTADDEIKPPPPGPIKRKVSNMTLKGNLSSEWLPVPGQDPCPWATVDHSATPEMGAWLHKEIIDFYEHFRPRKFEQAMRQALVDNLNKALRRNLGFRGCEVKAFGSFMSGLYLPMADMDLVICSESLLKQGWVTQRLCSKSSLYRFRAFLQNENIPTRDTIQVIAGARVPLVKYVDRTTGLKVDISFENIGGVKAIDRFMTWRRQYPAMPILVTIIKQYLSMRGLNEPVNGGIGGFSVICLVVSMLQLMPQVQSGDMIPEHHLGELLLEFFDLYGNRFHYEDVAIRLNPPGYVPKSQVNSFPYKALDRLSIIDPNNVNNDVSGGSYNFESVARGFRQGFETLKKRLAELSAQSPEERSNGSILEAILGGNYDNFEAQREYLRQLHGKTIGNCDDSPHVY
ncbi:related to DNA-directed DNA polymerase [Cephalotrichum gorgonifer]|uniref:polynucleotide adenylyltransferase n=1 Tax=Cephalotrichum gorgonifer TaxID=2041049 RepID=A0AAE8N832_9PEZI|nr:related to DNA-directed DNA polymerase [Cephalotrichum gorgonifer]